MTGQRNLITPFEPRILVVDDEKRIRDGAHKMLTQDGYDVAVAENGFEGLKMIEKEHFDIILLDLMMPGLSGMEVLAHVKTLHPDTVTIVITGYATLEHSVEAMKKGAFDFLSKPFSPEDLRVVVAKAIEYIRTLQDIATEKSRVRVLINHLADGVMATDNRKNVALANPAFLKMVGDPGREALGRPVKHVVLSEKIEEMIDQALAMSEEEFVELTAEINHRPLGETQEAVLGVRCIPFRDRLGRSLGTVTVLHDITALKRMDQMKSDLVSMVAHEVRSPLNTVLMQVKIVTDGLAGTVSPKQKEILERITDRLKSLVTLSAELLDLAKIESGLLTQEKEKIHLEGLIRDQVDFYLPRAQDKGIRLTLKPLPDLAPVLANRYNMEEVISNLISNAIKYTPEEGAVTVSALMENDYLCIRVSDTGIGISEDDREHILDRFYRVKDDKTRHITGTGLGLAIVKSILKAHNGTIRIESEVDKGSTFSVYLPTIPS
ncbi:MAG: response regulator [Deltaproteobacteria bacterium]|nr:response regulator [Deltaproteobacteria bacterium]